MRRDVLADVVRRWLRSVTGPVGRRVVLALLLIVAWVGWMVAPPRLLVSFDFEPGERVVPSPDGSRLYSVGRSDRGEPSESYPLRAWDTSTGRELFAVPNVAMPVFQISPDGRWLISRGAGLVISLRDAADGRLRLQIDLCAGRDAKWVRQVAFRVAPDSRVLASYVEEGERPVVQLWDLETGRPRATLDGASLPLAFSPDSRTLATGVFHEDPNTDTSPWLRLWDAATGRDITHLRDLPRTYTSVAAFSPDGRWLAAWHFGGDGRSWTPGLSVWDLSSGRLHAHFPLKYILDLDDNDSLRFSPDSRFLAILVPGPGVFWDLSADPPRNIDHVLGGDWGLFNAGYFPEFDRPGRRLLVPGRGRITLAVYDAATLTPIAEFRGPEDHAVLAPDGRVLAVLVPWWWREPPPWEAWLERWTGRSLPWRTDEDFIHFYDVDTGALRGRVPAGKSPSGSMDLSGPSTRSLVFSPDSRSLWWIGEKAGWPMGDIVRQWAVPSPWPPLWLIAVTAFGALLAVVDWRRSRRQRMSIATAGGPTP